MTIQKYSLFLSLIFVTNLSYAELACKDVYPSQVHVRASISQPNGTQILPLEAKGGFFLNTYERPKFEIAAESNATAAKILSSLYAHARKNPEAVYFLEANPALKTELQKAGFYLAIDYRFEVNKKSFWVLGIGAEKIIWRASLH